MSIATIYPLVLAVSSFILGQFLGFILSLPYWVLILVALVWLIALLLSKYPGEGALLAECTLALFCGIVSIEPFKGSSIEGDDTYLVQILSEPRIQETGRIELPLRFLATYDPQRSLKIEALKRPPLFLCRAKHLSWKNIHLAQQGDQFLVRAKFEHFERIDLWQPFSYRATLMRRGYVGSCEIRYSSHPIRAERPLVQASRDKIRSVIEHYLGEGERSGLILSMALGYRDVLSKGTEQAFKKLGLAHLLVVSGYQVGLVFGSVLLLFKSVTLFRRINLIPWLNQIISVLALILAALFVVLVGAEQSSTRAGIALTLFVVAHWLGRSRMDWRTLITSLLILCAIWPCCVFEPGVQLTYAALIGLSIGGRKRDTTESKLWRYLRATTLATLFTTVISMLWFKSISLWGFLLNPIVAPLLSIISCNIALVTLTLALAGIDPNAYLLNLVADLLWYFREQVWELSRVAWGYWEWGR